MVRVNVSYANFRTEGGARYRDLRMRPSDFDALDARYKMCSDQVNLLEMVIPRYRYDWTWVTVFDRSEYADLMLERFRDTCMNWHFETFSCISQSEHHRSIMCKSF